MIFCFLHYSLSLLTPWIYYIRQFFLLVLNIDQDIGFSFYLYWYYNGQTYCKYIEFTLDRLILRIFVFIANLDIRQFIETSFTYVQFKCVKTLYWIMAKNNDTKYSKSVFLCDNLQNGCQLKECYNLRKQNLIRSDNSNFKKCSQKEKFTMQIVAVFYRINSNIKNFQFFQMI